MSTNVVTAPDQVIERPDAYARYPLSMGQSDVWMQVQLYPEGDVSKLSMLFGISGDLEVPLARAALQSLVNRHEILRTTFAPGEDGELEQRILPKWVLQCEVIDCAFAPAETAAEDRNRRVEEAKKHAREQQSTPFALETQPPLRARLLLYEQGWNCLVLTFHRLLLDGLHGAQLMSEFAQSYKRLKLEQEPMAPPAVQYGEFARAQRSNLDAGLMEENLKFWRGHLLEPLPDAMLPVDFDAPQPRNAETVLHTHHLPVEFTAELRQAQKRFRATTIQIATAALVLLLHRISGDREFLIALPVSTRPRGMSGTIGFFSNILPLRFEVPAGATGESLVRGVSEQFRESLDRREFPWAEVLTELKSRGGGGQSLLPISVSQIGVLSKRNEGGTGDLALVGIGGYGSSSSHDLSLIVQEQVRVSLRFSFARDLFDLKTIENWGRYLEALIFAFVRTPSLDVEQIALSRNTVLATVAESKPAPFSLLNRFLEQVARRPDAVALSCGVEALTYRELNAKVNRWGRWLMQQIREPGVAISIDPNVGIAAVVAALAAFKAGITYSFRRRSTDQSGWWFDVAGAQAGAEALSADELPRCQPEPVYLDNATQWAGVGRPVEEHGASRLLEESADYAVRADDRVLLSSPEPPAAAFAMWSSLLHGSRLVVALDGDLIALGRGLGRDGISVLSMSATQFALVAEAVPDALDGVRMIVISGGPVPGKLLRHTAERLRKCSIVYTYSPPGEWPGLYSAVVVAEGRPWKLVGMKTSALGPALSICEHTGDAAAAGAFGEIFRADAQADLHATGDVGRWRPDGNLEYLGRLDSPLSIEGIRPALLETEMALREELEVQDVVLRLHEGISKQRRIVAYLAVTQLETFPQKQVRSRIAMRLPSYIRPSILVPMETLPRTASGEVDDAALPMPAMKQSEEYRAPRTTVEEELAKIWASVLGVEQVGIDDNFFELGGHSIAVLTVHRQICERLGMEFSLIAMFEHATIASLTQHLSAAKQGSPALNTGMLNSRAAQQMRHRLEQAQRHRGVKA